jgi:hypothetical protein
MALAMMALCRLVEVSLGSYPVERVPSPSRLVGAAGGTWVSSVATAYAFRGVRNEAFDWLAKGLATRDSDQLEGTRGDPEFAPLREDPRYKTILREMYLPE